MSPRKPARKPTATAQPHDPASSVVVSVLRERAGANRGKLNYASPGAATVPHLSGRMLSDVMNANMTHVPFRGGPPAIAEIVAGRVDMMFGNLAEILPHIRNGGVRAIAFTSVPPSPVLPGVPTIAAAGIEGLGGFEAGSWYGFLVPAKTSPQIVTRLHGDIMKAIKLPEVLDRMVGLGTDPIGSTPTEFSEQIKADLAKWAKVVQAAGMKPE